MALRALFVGRLPPRSGGMAVSLGQLLGGLSQAGMEIAAIAPITADHMQNEGDWYAASHPALRVYRYLMPAYDHENYRQATSELHALERGLIERFMCQLTQSFQPDLLIAGNETTGQFVHSFALESGLPWCQFLRGSPTGQILADHYPENQAKPYIQQFRAADRVIAVAEFMARGLATKFSISGVRTIANAIDLQRFQPRPKSIALLAELGLSTEAKIIICPGNLIARKRQLDVVQAAERVIAAVPDAVILFAGLGPLAGQLQEMIEARNLTDRVRLLGWVPNADMHDYFSIADIALMASESEGMSRVYLESLASGVALVASDIPSARELIVDGHNGRIFPTGDIRALGDTLINLLNNPQERNAIACNGRASVADRSIEAAVARYLQEFESIVNGAACPAAEAAAPAV